jgi:cytochrome c553
MAQMIAALAGAVALVAGGAASAASLGQTIAEQGDGKGAPACSGCHGAQYRGTPALKAPALAGLSKAYILQRLAHYSSPQGKNPSMRMVATALSPAERDAVAAYLSSLPKPPGPKAQ